MAQEPVSEDLSATSGASVEHWEPNPLNWLTHLS
jgi:hypothetical protein